MLEWTILSKLYTRLQEKKHHPMKTTAPKIITLDLHFQGYAKAIASYLIPHAEGAILIECGPGSTIPALKSALADHGYAPEEITDILLTHIHLDHAGSAGWFAAQGTRIHVHNVGAPHMIDPSRLLASAGRIYGEDMDRLWGDFQPVPEHKLHPLSDSDRIEIQGLVFQAVDTPGHAYHHMAYLLDDVCFSGDVGGVRIPHPGPRHIQIPMPPPELHLETWKKSIARLRSLAIQRIAPTHFGLYDDVDWHLQTMQEEIERVDEWMREIMPRQLTIDDLREEFIQWATERALAAGLEQFVLDSFEQANPSGMSADGIKRYWEKHVSGE